MSQFAEDLKNDYQEIDDKQMCTNCGEIVRCESILFVKGNSCCIMCDY